MAGLLVTCHRRHYHASLAPPHDPVPGFPAAPSQRHRPRPRILCYLHGHRYLGAHSFRRMRTSTVSTVGRVICLKVRILLLFLGLRSLFDAPDPDASPPRWMEPIDAMSPPRAFGFGMVLFPLQVKNLAIFLTCLNLIIASNLGPEGSILALDAGGPGLRHPGPRAHWPLCGRARVYLDDARVGAHVDEKAQPHDHGRGLLRVRSILSRQRALESVVYAYSPETRDGHGYCPTDAALVAT